MMPVSLSVPCLLVLRGVVVPALEDGGTIVAGLQEPVDQVVIAELGDAADVVPS